VITQHATGTPGRGPAVSVHLERLQPWVSPWVEIGVNPGSHLWADALDGCRAAVWMA
jgi:hypothetical protein